MFDQGDKNGKLEVDITNEQIELANRVFPPYKIDWTGFLLHGKGVGSRTPIVFQYCLDNGVLPSSLMGAHVILLPKPGKYLLECSSYRPFALLNQDLKKVLTKVLARLPRVISTLVAIDQTGLMTKKIKNKSTDTNLRRFFLASVVWALEVEGIHEYTAIYADGVTIFSRSRLIFTSDL